MPRYYDSTIDTSQPQPITSIYFILDLSNGMIKIGLADDVRRRMRQFQTGNPGRLELLATIDCQSRRKAFALERQLHGYYAERNIGKEWFNIPRHEVDAMLELVETFNEAMVPLPVPTPAAPRVEQPGDQRFYEAFRKAAHFLHSNTDSSVQLALNVVEDILKDTADHRVLQVMEDIAYTPYDDKEAS
jgi:hypothetical protein